MTVRFPIFEAISIRDYDLYPGTGGQGGLDVAFKPDENLVLGVNGLGKSTLLLLLKQMLEGPTRLRSPGFVGEKQPDFILADATMFSVRSSNGAPNAVAMMTVRFGTEHLVIRRRLRDLALTGYAVTGADGVAVEGDVAAYPAELARLAGVNSFAAVLRLCDSVVFFLENRERLLWDWRAQYEVLRSLLLSSADAAKLRALESQIVSADSAARNLKAAIHRLSTSHQREVSKIAKVDNVHAALKAVQIDLDAAEEEESRLVDALDDKRAELVDERTRSWAEDSKEDAAVARYDHLKYASIRHALGGASNDVQYLMLKIMGEGHCLVCDTMGLQALSEELKGRQLERRCLVCGSPRVDDPDITTTSEVLAEQARVAFQQLETQRETAVDARERLRLVTLEEAALAGTLRLAREVVDGLRRRRRGLQQQLPSTDRAKLARTESELDGLRSGVERFEQERDDAEAQVDELLTKLRTGAEGTPPHCSGLACHLHRAR